MTKGYVRKAQLEDVPVVASTMRSADVAEVKAFSGRKPSEALEMGLRYPNSSTRSICLPDGTPVGMFGVCPTQERVGAVWMLASVRIREIQRQFLRESRKEIEKLSRGYDLVFNFTDARNEVHHRWIQWAGFTIIKRHEEFGAEKRPFLEFVKIQEVSNV